MTEYDLNQVRKTDLTNAVDDFSVEDKGIDQPNNYTETTYDFPEVKQNRSYYKSIPELKKAIDAFAKWAVGKGFKTSLRNQQILKRIIGFGKDNFKSIIENMLVVKKYAGDSFAEIIRDDSGELLNLKPLSPSRMRIVVDKQGIIKRYDQLDSSRKNVRKTFQPEKILHLTNDRREDEIHGTSVIEACQWVIDARHEAMTDYRKVLHRNVVPVRIITIDTDDPTTRDKMISEYEEAIKKGEVLVLPKDTAEVDDTTINIQDPTGWIQYLENFFYQAVGIPRVIATSQDYTEAGAKIGYLTFEPIYTDEQVEIENEILNQIGIELTFNRPPSLKDDVQSDEQKNTGQTSFQPKESGINTQRE